MKSDINRRAAISGLALLPTLGQMLFSTIIQAQGTQAAPLASWPAKQTIIDFVRATTDQASPKVVPAIPLLMTTSGRHLLALAARTCAQRSFPCGRMPLARCASSATG